MTLPVSVLIPTRNEEKNIRKCLQSVSWASEIIVVDSASTDATASIAQELRATVVQFRWDGRGPRKKNWALEHLRFKHDWVMIVDADEEVTAQLRTEIQARLAQSSPYSGFLVSYDY